MSEAKRIRGGALLARALQEKGVEHVFTLSGGLLQSCSRRVHGMSDEGDQLPA